MLLCCPALVADGEEKDALSSKSRLSGWRRGRSPRRSAMQYGIYIASVVGALALVLMMPRRGYNPRWMGAILGAATLGGLWLFLARFLPDHLGLSHAGMAYYYIFSALAIASAVRVITHPKPVFSALWFIMLVCATAGIFIILSAEFMAFAMVIIYGGAILVTYVFVIMLAAQSEEGDTESAEPMEYDSVAREPVAAIAAGFLLLAVLLSVMFSAAPATRSGSPSDAEMIAHMLPRRANAELERRTAGTKNAESVRRLIEERGDADQLSNVERVGLDLFRSHPLSLELAGVILLVSLVGAVVIARKRVETPATAGRTPAVAGPNEAAGREPGPQDHETLDSIQTSSGGRAG